MRIVVIIFLMVILLLYFSPRNSNIVVNTQLPTKINYGEKVKRELEQDKFVKPNQLREIAKQNSLKFNKLDGVKLDLFLNKWKLSKDSSVNYISNFIKT